MKHLRYLWYLLRHKWFVLVAGQKTGASLRLLLLHDWSKFCPSEWFPYVEHFYGADRGKPNRPSSANFKRAFLHHLHRNKHHWQYWTMVSDRGQLRREPMPEKYIREMVADWMGAGRAKTGRWDIAEWWQENKQERQYRQPWWGENQVGILLEETTHKRVEELIAQVTT